MVSLKLDTGYYFIIYYNRISCSNCLTLFTESILSYLVNPTKIIITSEKKIG